MTNGWRTQAYALMAERIDTLTGEASLLRRLGIETVGDLLRHVPRRYLPSTAFSDLSTLVVGEEVAVVARVEKTTPVINNDRSRLEVILGDGSGATLRATFFGKKRLVMYWDKTLAEGVRAIFVGKVSEFNRQKQFTHPQFVVVDSVGRITGADKPRTEAQKTRRAMQQALSRSGLIGLYPASAKLPTWRIAAIEHLVLDVATHIPEPLPDWVVAKAGVLDWATALTEVHNPDQIERVKAGLKRLRFDEAFATQLTMAKRRLDAQQIPAIPRERVSGGLLDAFDARLPFTLTEGQREVGETLFAEIARDRPMQRLLQGEVGSGKTLVALRAMLAVVDAGGQAVMLAPTEVLATQHAATIRSLLGDLAEAGTLAAAEHATRVALVTGSLPAAQRRATLAEVASGEAGIVVGTHALLGEQVAFHDLGLVVVDEQHRFGVEQRAALARKAIHRPHVLVMTATPIPRSVAMTVFGDLEVSVLDHVPSGRADVSTTVVDVETKPAWVQRAWQRLREEVAAGRQGFVVAPRISKHDTSDESVADDAQAATVVDLVEHLSAGPLNGLRLGMLHGQLSTDEKERAMASFVAGEVDVLVATTMVEVGVDVPNASVMVICDADRFGISQLHQLRGRIGRGQYPGVCLLLTRAEEGTPARKRLDAVAGTRDGFLLAEVDLAQRREGDVLGAAQAGGHSSLRMLRVIEHAELIAEARELAEEALAKDPELTHPGLADAVRATELLAAGDYFDKS